MTRRPIAPRRPPKGTVENQIATVFRRCNICRPCARVRFERDFEPAAAEPQKEGSLQAESESPWQCSTFKRQPNAQRNELSPGAAMRSGAFLFAQKSQIYKRRRRFRGTFLVLIFEFMERIQLFKVGVTTRGTRSVAYLGRLTNTPAPGIGHVPCAGIWSP